jgi:hypothetical protein
MASKIFGGANLSDIARSTRERPEGIGLAGDKAPPGRPGPGCRGACTDRACRAAALERENIFSVEPRRCRAWAHHNRTRAGTRAIAVRI